MASRHQINANRQNAQHSTGPRTDEGRAASSRNAVTFGLYTRTDYVKPDERDVYKEFCETMYSQLCPDNLIEQSITAEITGATWRLRRCSAVEGELADFAPVDPMLDDKNEKTLRSLDRARTSSHSLLHRSLNQLRKLQTDRLIREELLSPEPVPAWAGIADYKLIAAAVKALQRGKEPEQEADDPMLAQLGSIMADPGISPELRAELLAEAMEKERQWNEAMSQIEPDESACDQLASNCESAETTENEVASASEEDVPAIAFAPIPRNSACPCRSGQKYKRCCGRSASPVLHKGAKIAA